MSAISAKNIGTRFERVEQMECWNGTSRTVGFVTIARNYQRWPAITLDNPRGSDADHSAVPSFSVNDYAESIVQRWFLGETGIDSIQNAALFFLTLSIEQVQAVGDLFRPRGIFHTEKFDYVASYVHASCRVQTRGDAKCDFSRGQRSSTDLRDLE